MMLSSEERNVCANEKEKHIYPKEWSPGHYAGLQRLYPEKVVCDIVSAYTVQGEKRHTGDKDRYRCYKRIQFFI